MHDLLVPITTKVAKDTSGWDLELIMPQSIG